MHSKSWGKLLTTEVGAGVALVPFPLSFPPCVGFTVSGPGLTDCVDSAGVGVEMITFVDAI